jgi:hypothetical protein
LLTIHERCELNLEFSILINQYFIQDKNTLEFINWLK